MTSHTIKVDKDLLRRYDVAGPRYTSYPTAPHFHEGFGEAELKQVIERSNQALIPAQLSLYVHVPFCLSPCFYCGCNRIITRDAARGVRYLADLRQEVGMIAPLFDRDREVVQLHFGGGTPNFLSAEQLSDFVGFLRDSFTFSDADHRDISIEMDPRTVSAADIGVLAKAGFNRASMGVQDFNPAVQKAVNRIQSVEQTDTIMQACRAEGFRSVNVDLIYGLPNQTVDGFARTLDTVIEMRPERLAVYSYAHLPHLFKAQKQLDASLLPSGETKLSLLQLSIETLTQAGYEYIGMDHFALPEDDLAKAQHDGKLHRNFMGYTTHAQSDLIGLGVSAISHIGDSFSQNHRDVPSWEAALNDDRLPLFRGMNMSRDDIIRADLIQHLMCHGEINPEWLRRIHHIDFDDYFKESLNQISNLERDGLVTQDRGHLHTTEAGRLLLRNIAMCFDAYFTPGKPAGEKQAPKYSKTI